MGDADVVTAGTFECHAVHGGGNRREGWRTSACPRAVAGVDRVGPTLHSTIAIGPRCGLRSEDVLPRDPQGEDWRHQIRRRQSPDAPNLVQRHGTDSLQALLQRGDPGDSWQPQPACPPGTRSTSGRGWQKRASEHRSILSVGAHLTDYLCGLRTTSIHGGAYGFPNPVDRRQAHVLKCLC